MYITYILMSSDGTHYIGSTDNMDRRIREHNSENGKKNRFTKKYSDWRVLYTKSYLAIEESRKREKEIKSWKWGNKFKQLIEQSRLAGRVPGE